MPAHARRHQLQGSLLYHAYNRCAIRSPIFHREEDFRHFKDLLAVYTERFSAAVYHWAIMQTHFHLLLELEDPPTISRFMGALAHAYTHYHHKNFDTRGFLWQGRFKLQPIQRECYLHACGRYIENNPVRAGLVAGACEYPWSSARFYCLGERDGVTHADPSYTQDGADSQERRLVYMQFLGEPDPDAQERLAAMEEPVGGAAFRGLLRRKAGRLMPRRQGRKPGIFEPYPAACV